MLKLQKYAESIICRMKSDPNYSFNQPLSDREIIYCIYYRLIQLIRGLNIRLKLSHSKGLIFAGRNVIIEHGYRISSGNGLILEDCVNINALSKCGISFGRNVTIKHGAVIVCSGVINNKGVGLKVGDNSAIGSNNHIAAQGGIEIGNDVIIGPGVMIFSEDHHYSTPDIPIRKQGEKRIPVVIEDNCWIGAGAIILKGVRIGKGSIIAAGSLVNKDVAADTLTAGVPAKYVKNRLEL